MTVGAAAYTAGYAGAPATTLFAIDMAADRLVRIGGPGGVPSADTGLVTPVGALGVDAIGDAGFDVTFGDTAYASLTSGGYSRLYVVSLSTGAAWPIAPIGDGAIVTALAVNSPQTVTLFGVTATNDLVRFSSMNPATLLSSTPITGLASGETLIGVDVRPRSDVLYAVGTTSRLYTIDPASAVATPPGPPFAPALDGASFSVDFDPTDSPFNANRVDAIRIVSDNGQDLPARSTNRPGDLGAHARWRRRPAGGAYVISARGYPTNLQQHWFGIDVQLDRLVHEVVDSSGQAALEARGALLVDASAASLDIAHRDGYAYAALSVGGTTSLYLIDLTTGAARRVARLARERRCPASPRRCRAAWSRQSRWPRSPRPRATSR